MKIPKGKLSYTEIKNKHDLQPVRRHLEKYFPILGLAENQWAATCFLQEVERRDKGKGSGRSRAEVEEEREGREAVGCSQASSEGGIQDEEEVEAFGEEAESQEAPAKVSSVVIDGRRDRQTRSRILPATARSSLIAESSQLNKSIANIKQLICCAAPSILICKNQLILSLEFLKKLLE